MRSNCTGLAALFLTLSCLVCETAFAERTQYIQVRNATVRAQPKSYSKAITKLKYRDEVRELEEADGWLKVSVNGKTGYLHETSVSTKQIVLSKTDVSPYSNEDDVVLAGKGFSKEVEKQYKKDNPDKSRAFAALDKLESTYRDWNPQIATFRKKGQLTEGEG